jgi:hypothetical protein
MWVLHCQGYRLLSDFNRQTSYYSGQGRDAPRTVQSYVTGENTTTYLGYSSAQPQPQGLPQINIQPPPEASVTTTEGAMGDQPEPEEQMAQHDFEPTPTAEQRRFSAPQMEWDASRSIQLLPCKHILTLRVEHLLQQSQNQKLQISPHRLTISTKIHRCFNLPNIPKHLKICTIKSRQSQPKPRNRNPSSLGKQMLQNRPESFQQNGLLVRNLS